MRRGKRQTLREADIKAALIDRVLASPDGRGDAVLVSEMPVLSASRRADVVLANGKLHAFEIKSDADRLDRLAGQIRDLAAIFERVTVVTVPKFADRVACGTPSEIGLIVAEQRASGVRLFERRPARPLPFPKDAAIRFLTVADLRRLARAAGEAQAPHHRAGLERVARELPDELVRKAARDAVKRRYRSAHASFVEGRLARSTTAEDLARLRRARPPAELRPLSEMSDGEPPALAEAFVAAPAVAIPRQKSSLSSSSSETPSPA